MELSLPNFYIVAGGLSSGKTHLIKNIMYELNEKFNQGVLFSNTSFDSEQYSFLPKECVYSNYDEKVLQNLVDTQIEYIRKGDQRLPAAEKTNAFVIFDDCLEKSIFSSQLVQKICMYANHYHITTIISASHINMIPPIMRGISTGAFIFPSNDEPYLRSCHDYFGQKFSYNDFKKYVSEISEKPYNFIYHDRKNPSKCPSKGSIEEIYKVSSCPDSIPDFYVKVQNTYQKRIKN